MMPQLKDYLPRLVLLALLLTVSPLFAQQPDNTSEFTQQYWQQLELEIAVDPNLTLEKAKALVTHFEKENNTPLQARALVVVMRCLFYLEQRENMVSTSDKGLQLARQLQDRYLESIFSIGLGLGKIVNQEYIESKRLIKLGFSLAESQGEKALMGEALMALGYLSNELGYYDEALDHYLAANELYLQFGTKINQSESLSAISLAYGSLGQKQKSIEYQKKSLSMIDPEVDIMDASITYYNLGVTYREINDLVNAKHYMQLALKKSQQINDAVGIAFAEYELSALASEEGNTELALQKTNQVIEIFKTNGLNNMVTLCLMAKARHLAVLGQPGAFEALKEAKLIIDKNQSTQRQIDYFATLSFVYEKNNNMAKALETLREKEKKQAELHKKQMQSKTQKIQAGFDFKQKETDNQLLQKDLALQSAKIAEKDSQKLILMLILGFVITVLASIGFLLRTQIRSKERFKNLALYDELTKAPNRRHIMEYARRKQDDHILFSEPVVLAILDIDWFKKVNDQFGHDVGDNVLVKFAQCLQQALRNNDKFGRIGGEEWLVVLPSTQLSKVKMVFNRLQKILAEENFQGLPNDYAITASMGATQIKGKDKSIEDTLKRADKKLYQAKQAGRNCLIV